MATLNISYFGSYSDNCAMDPLGEEDITISGTSAQSTFAAAKYPRFALLYSDTACHVTQGSNPTATTTNGMKLPATTERWVRVVPGYKFAAIT